MDIKQHLEKLNKITTENIEVIKKISNEAQALEEAMDKLFLINLENISVEIDDLETTEIAVLSVEKVNQKSRTYRIMYSGLIKGKPTRRPLVELPVPLRLKAYDYLPVLLEKMYENQLSVKKFIDQKYEE